MTPADPVIRRLVHAPGVAVVVAVAAAALVLHRLPGLSAISPLMLAILVGIAIRSTVRLTPGVQRGIGASLGTPLRLGIVLFGLQLTLTDLAQMGAPMLLIVSVTVTASYAVTVTVGRCLGVDAGLARLIAIGTSVCGASAVVAANAVLRERDATVAYALGVVTLMGTAAMLALPALGVWLSLSPRDYGLWVGLSVHEVAQVIAAAFALGDEAGQSGTITKLSRVLAIVPLVLLMAAPADPEPRGPADAGPKRSGQAVPRPWFVLGFVLAVAFASTGCIPTDVMPMLQSVTHFVLAAALAAVGLATDLRQLSAFGWRPVALGTASAVFISGIGLMLISVFVAG